MEYSQSYGSHSPQTSQGPSRVRNGYGQFTAIPRTLPSVATSFSLFFSMGSVDFDQKEQIHKGHLLMNLVLCRLAFKHVLKTSYLGSTAISSR